MYNSNSLIFKTIEDEATQSGLNITSIFGKVKTELDALLNKSDVSTISFGNEFENLLQSDKAALEAYQRAVDGGISETEALTQCMNDASVSAREYAIAHDITTSSIEKFAAQQRMAEIATTAQSKSFVNVRSIIKTYNTDVEKLGLTNQEFTDSVRKGNRGLGDYLASVGNGEATMRGYITSLVKAKAATIGMQVATTLLNAAISLCNCLYYTPMGRCCTVQRIG